MAHDFQPGGWNNLGHDNRVFAVKYLDENTLISGGWDSVVHIWDVRQKRSAHHFYGPNISGESLDYENGMVLAGCYSAQNQIQFWDVKTLKKVEEIDWTAGNIDDAEYIYAAGFSKWNPEMFAAGSTGPKSEVRFFRESKENPHVHTVIGKLGGLSEGCFSLDFSRKGPVFAFSTPHHGLYIYQYKL